MNGQNNDTAFFDLDDEDIDLIPTIDSSHQFLNFSRKITEAASMRKPVDIQLGIACGKDLFFPSFIKPPQEEGAMFSTERNIEESSLLSSPLDEGATPPSPTFSETTVVKDESSSENDYGYSDKEDTLFFDYKNTNDLPTLDFSTNDNVTSFFRSPECNEEDTTSISLDKLVADVFNYMDSCPNHSAYSEDLQSLKSKLEDYNSSRTSFESNS